MHRLVTPFMSQSSRACPQCVTLFRRHNTLDMVKRLAKTNRLYDRTRYPLADRLHAYLMSSYIESVCCNSSILEDSQVRHSV